MYFFEKTFPTQMQHPTPDASSTDFKFRSFLYPSHTTAALRAMIFKSRSYVLFRRSRAWSSNNASWNSWFDLDFHQSTSFWRIDSKNELNCIVHNHCKIWNFQISFNQNYKSAPKTLNNLGNGQKSFDLTWFDYSIQVDHMIQAFLRNHILRLEHMVTSIDRKDWSN